MRMPTPEPIRSRRTTPAELNMSAAEISALLGRVLAERRVMSRLSDDLQSIRHIIVNLEHQQRNTAERLDALMLEMNLNDASVPPRVDRHKVVSVAGRALFLSPSPARNRPARPVVQAEDPKDPIEDSSEASD